MGFMDDISAFTKGVGQKAKGNYDVVAMNNRVSSLNKEILQIYSQIGKQYYETRREMPDEDFVGLIDRVKQLEEEIEDVKQQIERTKAATAAVSLKATTTIDEEVVDASNGFCESCGAPLPTESIFCIRCGAKIESAS